jgi:hypothetical protein
MTGAQLRAVVAEGKPIYLCLGFGGSYWTFRWPHREVLELAEMLEEQQRHVEGAGGRESSYQVQATRSKEGHLLISASVD